ncbi:hypothetical protein HOI83_01455 [Candidatus Uhrbacteria bacterium]|jgi:serine/threonine protein kinase|nr:hypothetical protein [Candidatus Uhrbacteria bacterium]
MGEAARQIPQGEVADQPSEDLLLSNLEVVEDASLESNEGHLVSWAEERSAKDAERTEARERQGELDDIEDAVRSGEYDEVKMQVGLWRVIRLFGEAGKRSTEYVKAKARKIQERRDLVAEETDLIDTDNLLEAPKDLDLDPSVLEALTEHEKVDGPVMQHVTRSKTLEDGRKVAPSVTIAKKEYAFTKEDMIGRGTFGLVSVAHPVIEAIEVHDEAGKVVEHILDIDVEDLHPPIIKVIDHAISDDGYVERAMAGEVAALDHKGVLVGVKKFVGKDGEAVSVIAMERAEGKDLASVTREHGEKFRTPEGRLLLAKGMLAAFRDLARLHDEGVSHKDIKPGNIMMPLDRPEHAKIIDYGMVKRVAKKGENVVEEQGDSEIIEGTPRYMTFGGIHQQFGSYMDMDTAAVGKAFGLLFDGYDFLNVATLIRDGSDMYDAITRGDLYDAPDFENPLKKEGYLDTLEFYQEHQLAELIYEIVLPHDSGEVREQKRLRGELLTVHDIIPRLEAIVRDFDIVMRANRVLENVRHGDVGSAVSPEQLSDLKATLTTNSDVGRLEEILADVGRFQQERPSSRVEAVERMRTLHEFIQEGYDEWSSRLLRNPHSGTAEIVSRIEADIEEMRVDIVKGDTGHAQKLNNDIMMRQRKADDYHSRVARHETDVANLEWAKKQDVDNEQGRLTRTQKRRALISKSFQLVTARLEAMRLNIAKGSLEELDMVHKKIVEELDTNHSKLVEVLSGVSIVEEVRADTVRHTGDDPTVAGRKRA